MLIFPQYVAYAFDPSAPAGEGTLVQHYNDLAQAMTEAKLLTSGGHVQCAVYQLVEVAKADPPRLGDGCPDWPDEEEPPA